jgi:hypothetical protein
LKIILPCVIAMLLCSTANAQTAQVERIDVVEYGLYTTSAGGKLASENVPSGTVTNKKDIRHVQTTNVVPGQLGIEFGLRFNIVGSPAGTVVPLHVVAIFPAQGLHDPSAGRTFTTAEYDRADAIGPGGYLSYTFDHDWEVVPGVWTFQIWNQGRKLAEQQFTVVFP